jgi:hypothetical protein
MKRPANPAAKAREITAKTPALQGKDPAFGQATTKGGVIAPVETDVDMVQYY